MEQKTIILDITDCKDLNDLHKRIKETFDFPDFYGNNWDAFWDLLRSECDSDKLIIKGTNTLTKEFDEHIAIFKETLDEYIAFRDKYTKCGLKAFDYEIIS